MQTLFSVIFLEASDFSKHLSRNEKRFQAESMLRVVHIEDVDIDDHRRPLVLQGLLELDDPLVDTYDVCIWNGVRCAQDVVWEIKWKFPMVFLHLSLEWLPPTIHYLEINDQNAAIKGWLITRAFPRDLQSIRIGSCEWPGTLDLTTLPHKLEILVSIRNQLQGTLNLTNLPATMQIIRLEGDLIQKVVVSNQALPNDFQELFVESRKVSVEEIYGEPVDSRIIVQTNQKKTIWIETLQTGF
mmetsp:Transcript_8478/g.12823  ORF Transcript_8478/g.12823 Transcript_8478/m.12823 type:complete len:242 (+) Transcript_8478:19-744(+)